MGSESILRGHEAERNNFLGKIQPFGQENIKTKHLALVNNV